MFDTSKAEANADLAWANVLPAAGRALDMTDPRYLKAAFDEIDRRWASLGRYLEQEMGLSKIDIASLRSRHIE